MPTEADKVTLQGPSAGGLTFAAEGTEGGRFHSRKLHVPGASSGLTLGRGYDMKERPAKQIEADLKSVGVDAANAKLIAKAAGKSGAAAKKFIKDNGLAGFEISADAQTKLFEKSYAAAAADVKRISSKQDTVKAYGAVDWDSLDPAIRDLLVDLRFRGDYTGAARGKIQKLVAANDLDGLSTVLSDSAQWSNVPKDRFQRRKAYLTKAAAAKKAAAEGAGAGAIGPVSIPVSALFPDGFGWGVRPGGRTIGSLAGAF